MTPINALVWLLAVMLGLQTGAGLYETRVLVPLWANAPPQSVVAYFTNPMRPDSGRRFWIMLTPTVGIVSLVNLIAAWQSTGPRRAWWLGSSAASVLVVAATFGYFVPALLRLARADERSAAEVVRAVRWWVKLNWVRAAVLTGAWLAALRALTYSG
jgi:hypothetical protein